VDLQSKEITQGLKTSNTANEIIHYKHKHNTVAENVGQQQRRKA